jgi:hypothetical protein
VVAVPETMMILFSPPCAFDGVIKNNEKHADVIKTFFASKLSLHQPFYKRAYFSYKGFVKAGGLFKRQILGRRSEYLSSCGRYEGTQRVAHEWIDDKEGQKNEFKVQSFHFSVFVAGSLYLYLRAGP